MAICNNKAKLRYRVAHPERMMLRRAYKRALKLGREFNIEESDIVIPETCPILGFPLKKKEGKSKVSFNTATLDRIDNSKGYIKGNVAVISFRANLLKSNLSITEITNLFNYMSNGNI